ncbi:anaerobic ribonucleoside-triphosphate reductase activating protein [Aquibacillus koreensis]|uniref:Anaerobic ribonucleoside-triphosphate reductase-activating protein n=1 Tax=Aquibacillus koreensis TaxID=279446 RepID=A0A9X3WQ76_9BACI|nr:anaerobic ribonucleoside-triphosphate reductase activating protein [Aquibacillus koreensis]MCT2535436.1 anaerobic ribonucleoside-triphosphate reductase activating protein [Aquibacillus koreensis]MDC3422271.1 anaerobic ribonucleoside-triphosphate reductase activating protein [Aquibacillus koreensis]
MRVMNIIHDSVVDGEGLRTVVFFAGCPHFCKGCHNPQSWNIRNGTEMSVEDILTEIKSNPLTDVTLSGGEPFFQAKEVSVLAKKIKKSGKNIWIYSGYTYEEIRRSNDRYKRELLHYCDILVEGPFILEQRDLSLRFHGSRNQRIIDLTKKSEFR